MAHCGKELLCFREASSWRKPASGAPYTLVLDLLFWNTYRTAFGTNKWEHPGKPFSIAVSQQSRIRAVSVLKNCLSVQSRLVYAGWDWATQNCKVMHKGNFVLCSGKFVLWKVQAWRDLSTGLDYENEHKVLWKHKADIIGTKASTEEKHNEP